MVRDERYHTMKLYDAFSGRTFGSLFERVSSANADTEDGQYYIVNQTISTLRDGENYSGSVKRYYKIPQSLHTIHIERGYLPYDTFGGLKNTISIYFGNNVEPTRKMFGEVNVNEKKCCNNQITKDNGVYIDGWLISEKYSSSDIKLLENCRGIADYACTWRSIKIYNTAGPGNNIPFEDIPLNYIGVRALAGVGFIDTSRQTVKTITLPQSLKQIKYLACDTWSGINELYLYDTLERIEHCALKRFTDMTTTSSGIIAFKNANDAIPHNYDVQVFRDNVVQYACLPARYNGVSTLGITAATLAYIKGE
jgi:hypothetical protein